MADTPPTGAAVTSTAPRLRYAFQIGLTAAGVAVAVTVTIVLVALTGANRATTRSNLPSRDLVAYIPRTSRLDAADWLTVNNAIRLRGMALDPGRTAQYRAFAAYVGLSGLVSLHPVLRGQCATAVSYLYDNLLDLRQAYPGEDWRPLRRLIRTQPPLSACAPKVTHGVTYVG